MSEIELAPQSHTAEEILLTITNNERLVKMIGGEHLEYLHDMRVAEKLAGEEDLIDSLMFAAAMNGEDPEDVLNILKDEGLIEE